jgi:hypothetical protein
MARDSFLLLLLLLSLGGCGTRGATLDEGGAERAIRHKEAGLVPAERPFAEVRHFRVTALTRVDASHYRAEYEYADVPKDQPLREGYVLERYAVTIERVDDSWKAQPATRESRGQARRGMDY